jgi:rare lipoprotein A
VFGRNYQPMTALVPYQQRGFASWYGRKFHGQKTASGEVYNMFAMTAAHPTLPIPSYVRVTNTRTGERVIVRVNDRGPFLNDRLIDLSYTAAAKLGYIQAGSAQVDVELLSVQDVDSVNATAPIAQSPATAGSTNIKKSEPSLAALVDPPSVKPVPSLSVPSPSVPSPSVPSPSVPSPSVELREERLLVEITVKQDDVPAVPNAKPNAAIPAEKPTAAPTTIFAEKSVAAPTLESVAAPAKTYLQLGAFSTSESAESTREKVRKQLDWFTHPIEIVSETGLFKLRAGPYGNRKDANAMAERIRVATGSKPFLMMR